MNIKWFTGGGLALAVVLLFAVNIFSATVFRNARLDLTEGERHTLSQGTRNILSGLEGPVTLRLFLSQKQATRLPGISAHATRVRELLEEYRRIGDGLVRVHFLDPRPFSEAEDRAMDHGLAAVPWKDGGEPFYFGLVASGPTGPRISIPFLSPDRGPFLEYDLTGLIHRVAYPDKKVIGFIGPRTAFHEPVFHEIGQRFEARPLPPGIQEIPADVELLVLIHPKGLGDNTLYAIDQFVLRGGKALVFVDPYSEAQASAMTPEQFVSDGAGSNLAPLFAAWGIEYSPNQVVADSRLAVTDHPLRIRLSGGEMDGRDPITANLNTIFLASPGRFRAISGGAMAGSETRLSPLLWTTTNAMELDTVRLALLADPQELLNNYRGQGERYILAARVTGRIESAFPDGPPDGPPGGPPGDPADGPPRHLSASGRDIHVVVVADTDMLQARFRMKGKSFSGAPIAQSRIAQAETAQPEIPQPQVAQPPLSANGAFVINAIEHLTGSDDLIDLRSRGYFQRPFTRADTIREAAQARFRDREGKLLTELREAEHTLMALKSGRQGNSTLVLGEAQQREIRRFGEEKRRVRKELRALRRELRKDRERMENRLKFINIGLVPSLIGIGALVVAVYRSRRRKKRFRDLQESAPLSPGRITPAPPARSARSAP